MSNIYQSTSSLLGIDIITSRLTRIVLKALLSVFKGRAGDFKDKDTAIERCEAQLFDSPEETECRFVVQMICKHGEWVNQLYVEYSNVDTFLSGVLRTYKLTYEPADVQHALFGRSDSQNQWSVDSRFLREILEHFGRGAEHLDVYCEDGRAVFTSYTEKIIAGTGMLVPNSIYSYIPFQLMVHRNTETASSYVCGN